MSKLVPNIFYSLCKHFFLEDGTKLEFELASATKNISDPFVEYIENNLLKKIEAEHIVAPPHISPDLAFYQDPKKDLFGIEVKTSKSRSGDINFNSTPPCGKIVVSIDGKDAIVPCYYLFVQLNQIEEEKYDISSMMLIDGDFINSDFDLYMKAIGVREKKIDLGSYGDGMDRQRPMFVFPNPLGISGLRSERSTLISKERFTSKEVDDKIGLVATLDRDGQMFFAYQAVRNLKGPFTNVSRSTATKIRNKLKVTTNDNN